MAKKNAPPYVPVTTSNKGAKGSLPKGVKIPKEPTTSTMQVTTKDQKGRTVAIGKREPIKMTRIKDSEF